MLQPPVRNGMVVFLYPKIRSCTGATRVNNRASKALFLYAFFRRRKRTVILIWRINRESQYPESGNKNLWRIRKWNG